MATIEEKAKRYDEVFSAAKEWYNNPNSSSIGKSYLYAVFPELKESEDERIRKALIEMIHDTTGDELWVDYDVHKEDALAWLEKVGNIIKEWGDLKVRYIQDDLQEMVDLKQKTEQSEQNPADEIGNYDHGKVLDSLMSAVIKTPEESLGIDSDTYNKIVDECIYGEQKPAWSEEDEHRAQDTIYFLDTAKKHYASTIELDACIDWLKSIKDRVVTHPKQELSQNDIDMIDWLIRCCEKEYEELCNDKYGHQDIVSDLKRDCRKKWNWLESLKNKVVPQNKWKPSERQIYLLNWVANILLKDDGIVEKETAKELQQLLEQLKKLKGE